MAKRNEPSPVNEEEAQDTGRIERRLDMLDQRLDNIDSVVTAVVERVMNQPVTIYITCPKCGESIEIALLGSRKPRK